MTNGRMNLDSDFTFSLSCLPEEEEEEKRERNELLKLNTDSENSPNDKRKWDSLSNENIEFDSKSNSVQFLELIKYLRTYDQLILRKMFQK